MHSPRFGSMLNRRALHSATQLSRLVSQEAAVTQAVQLPAVCATDANGDTHAPSTRTRRAYRAIKGMVTIARD